MSFHNRLQRNLLRFLTLLFVVIIEAAEATVKWKPRIFIPHSRHYLVRNETTPPVFINCTYYTGGTMQLMRMDLYHYRPSQTKPGSNVLLNDDCSPKMPSDPTQCVKAANFNCVYKVHQAKFDDQGIYNCQLKLCNSSFKTQSDSINVGLYDTPILNSVKQSPESGRVALNKTFSLSCVFTPPRNLKAFQMKIQWRLNSPAKVLHEVDLVDAPNPYVFSQVTDRNTSSGWYVCAIVSANYRPDKKTDAVIDYVAGKRRIEVQHSPEIKEFSSTPVGVTKGKVKLPFGVSNDTVFCTGDGNPLPAVWWTFQGKNLSVLHIQTATLNFSFVTHESSGNYCCNVANQNGEVKKCFTLIVNGVSNWTKELKKIGIPSAAVFVFIVFIVFIVSFKKKRKGNKPEKRKLLRKEAQKEKEVSGQYESVADSPRVAGCLAKIIASPKWQDTARCMLPETSEDEIGAIIYEYQHDSVQAAFTFLSLWISRDGGRHDVVKAVYDALVLMKLEDKADEVLRKFPFLFLTESWKFRKEKTKSVVV
eukprot:m.216461 g.216461  ORF g.216461 m.216461 type:complete len:533 (+) comp39869_c0_seq17:136-1734(+)